MLDLNAPVVQTSLSHLADVMLILVGEGCGGGAIAIPTEMSDPRAKSFNPFQEPSVSVFFTLSAGTNPSDSCLPFCS